MDYKNINEDPFLQTIERSKHYSFANDIEFRDNDEGGTFIWFSFFFYFNDKYFGGDNESISIYKLLPKNWNLRDVIIDLVSFLRSYNSEPNLEVSDEYLGVTFNHLNKDQNILVQQFLEGDYEILFKDAYKFMPDDILKTIRFKKDSISRDDLNNMGGELFGFLDYSVNNNDFRDNRIMLLNKFIVLYELYGDDFHMNEKIFKQYNGFKFISCIAFFYMIDFIKITSISTSKIDDVTGEEFYEFGIQIQDDFKDMLLEEVEKRNVILDKLFDEKYKQVTLKKKDGEPYMLEGDLEVLGDNTKFVDLTKKYPYSKIEMDSHDGKINKYKIKEKIKLNK